MCRSCVVAPYSRISLERMPFVVEERGKENIVSVRLLSRDACVVGNAHILYTLPSCHIDALQYLYIPLSNLRGSKVQVVNRLGWLMQIQSLCARSRSPKMPCIRLLVPCIVSPFDMYVDTIGENVNCHIPFNTKCRGVYGTVDDVLHMLCVGFHAFLVSPTLEPSNLNRAI